MTAPAPRDGAPVADLRDVKMVQSLGAVADELARQHGALGVPCGPDLPPGLVREARWAVFGYLGVPMPEQVTADVAGHAAVGESSCALDTVAALANAVDAAWAGDDEDTRAELVKLAATVIRWVQAIDRRG